MPVRNPFSLLLVDLYPQTSILKDLVQMVIKEFFALSARITTPGLEISNA
jgi:hypothetical protein